MSSHFSSSSSSSRRRPSPSYEGKNGFSDHVALQIKGNGGPSFPQNAGGSGSGPLQQRSLHDAAEKHRLAQDAFEFRGSYCPGLDTMKEFVEKLESGKESSSDVRDRLNVLQRKHREGTVAMVQRLAQEYHDEALADYCSRDPALDSEELDTFFTSVHSNNPQVFSALSTLSNHQYADMSTFVPLVKRCTDLKIEEDAARRRRDARFPMNASEFRAISSRDIQLRIARFLQADGSSQDRMMTEFNWAYRQVTPLQKVYKADVSKGS
ncbi:hypothetical protein NLI96_g4605 [Meripilus lineatus]|uniref:Uncharacterized protein n=1 Tax=Meripilus lineatus TaxID=2056292 RepID=A0AAD5V6I6_9APHY|nr:hypothetical protein NLI96_g4605 [Physisporinus lineatus]